MYIYKQAKLNTEITYMFCYIGISKRLTESTPLHCKITEY